MVQSDSFGNLICSYPKYLRWFFLLGSAAIGLVVFASLQSISSATDFAGVIFLSALVTFSLHFAHRTSSRIQVDRHSISWTKPFRSPISIEWSDISTLSGSLWDPSLKLSDQEKGKTISVDPWIRGYSSLIDIIRRSRPDLWRSFGLTTFVQQFSL